MKLKFEQQCHPIESGVCAFASCGFFQRMALALLLRTSMFTQIVDV